MVGTSDEPMDLYSRVHKGLRLALFRLVSAAGSADGLDDDQVDDVVTRLRDTVFVLRAHHRYEDEFVRPLIGKHCPELEPVLAEGHRATDEMIDGIELAGFSLHVTLADERVEVMHELYLELAALTASYLAHLAYTEQTVSPALNEAMSRADLVAVRNAIRAHVPPRDMCSFLEFMLPAMNLAERADLLLGMHADASAEVWAMVDATAREALSAEDYDAVAARISPA